MKRFVTLMAAVIVLAGVSAANAGFRCCAPACAPACEKAACEAPACEAPACEAAAPACN